MTTGTCPHDTFNLMEGCKQCVEERRELADQVKGKLEAYLVKVRYYSQTTGVVGEREYTYYSEESLSVGTVLMVPTRNTRVKAIVSAIDVPESEIEAFKDSVKSIPAGSNLVNQPNVALPDGEEADAAKLASAKERALHIVVETEQFLKGVDTKVNLCDTCRLRNDYPICCSPDIEFGDGKGNDNIIKCSKHSEGPAEPCSIPLNVEITPGTETAVIKINPQIAPSFTEHLEAVNRILEIAKARTILSEDDAKAANDDVTVIDHLLKAVDTERKTFTVPLNEYLSSINGDYKLITGPLTEADQITRKLLTAYKVEQKRKVQETEALNQKALEVAQEQARLNHGEFTTDIKPVPLPYAPKLTRTDQGTSGLKENWKYRIIDLAKLPREYMVPNDAMLSSIAKQQHEKQSVPGIEFYNEYGLQVRSR